MTKIGFNVLAWSAEISPKLFPILDRLKAIGYDAQNFLLGIRMLLLAVWWGIIARK